MLIEPLALDSVPAVHDLMARGEPYVKVRTLSDYWLYARLFSATCPVAIDRTVVGAVIAFQSQDDPSEVYIQDVMIQPERRRQGVAQMLMRELIRTARSWHCERVYLTSEPENIAAHLTWRSLGFNNVAGDYTQNGISIIRNYKGPGKDRAIYELDPRRVE